ncbi:MAG TPA: hypothetical protein VHD91_08145 [Gaiellaceae bacterium]|nr:hypothetical protein [Gaiellaceae bacterium]
MSVSDYVAGGRSERAARERRRGVSVGAWGIAMVIASEATLFGTFIGSYFYLRFHTVHWPPLGTPKPEVAIPLVMVAVLTTTSLPMQKAAWAAAAGRLWRTRLWLCSALVVQLGYLAYELRDLVAQLQVSTPQDNAYASIYYVLLVADHAHVAFGIVLVLWLLWRLRSGLTAYRANATQVAAFYWHAVNLLTWIVIGTLLSAAA